MVVNAGAWSILGSLFEKILMLATYVIVSREVAPVEFGYLVLILLIIELMGYVAGFGVGENIIRKKVVNELFMANSFYFVCYASLVLVLTMLIFVAPISYLVSGDDLVILVLWMVFYPALTVFSGFYLAILQRDMRFKDIAYRTVVISIISGAVGIALALSGFGVLSLIGAKYAYSIIDLLILRHLTNFSPSARVNRVELIGIYDFGWKISVAQLLNFSNSRIYEVFVTFIFGPAYLAVLDVGRKFLMTFYRVVLTPLNSVCLSTLSKVDNPVVTYLNFSKVVGLIVVPVAAGMGALSKPIILMLFGVKWEGASIVLMLLSFGSVVQVTAWFLPNLVISLGYSSMVLVIQAIIGVTLCLSGIVGVVFFDDFYSLIACLVFGLFFSSFICSFYLWRTIQFPLKMYLYQLVGFTVLYAVFYCLSIVVYDFIFDIVSTDYFFPESTSWLISLVLVGIVIAFTGLSIVCIALKRSSLSDDL